MVLLDAGALCKENPIVAMFNGGPGWFGWNHPRSQVVGVKAVIGHQDVSCVWPAEFHQSAKHHVVIDIGCRDDVFVDLKVFFINVILLGSAILHEAMAEMVDRVVIDRSKVPFLVLQ